MPPTSSSVLFRRAVPLAAVTLAIVLSACGKTNPPTSLGENTPTGSQSNSGSTGTESLSSLSAEVKAAESAHFKAVYTADENGNTSTVTIEQAPPKSLFLSGQGEVVDTGTATYFCSTQSGSSTCVSESSSTNPLAGLAALFSPAAAVTALEGYQSEVAAKVVGVSTSFSSGTFGGQAATCVTISHGGDTAKYCVTNSGILAYEGANGNSFQLTSYTSATPDSDFSIPSGATVESIPATGGTS